MTLSTLDDRLVIAVTFNSAKGYVANHPELPTVSALSLNGLRQQIEGVAPRAACHHAAPRSSGPS